MKEAALKILARLRDDKKLETLVYALLACVVAAAFLAGGGANCRGKTVTERESPEKPASTEAELESRLEAILSQIKGAGRVRVMITFDRGSEIVPARESQRSTGENGSNESSKPLTVSSSGGQSPIVLAQIMPKVRGVIVVAEGAGDIGVRNELERAAMTALGTDLASINVFCME
ncbi:MAG: hypothetical protein II155_05515 [Clostridia bacterium]|nr:hypothetical protein [Clostridia bacterium]